jgi:hypothetical protein
MRYMCIYILHTTLVKTMNPQQVYRSLILQQAQQWCNLKANFRKCLSHNGAKWKENKLVK